MNYLYRCFNGEHQLLYVGLTKNPMKRMIWHKNNKSHWIDGVAAVTWEKIGEDKGYALLREREAIAAEMPIHNKYKRQVLPLKPSYKKEVIKVEAKNRRDDLVAMRDDGKTLQEIATVLGVSRQRVHQLIKKARAERAAKTTE